MRLEYEGGSIMKRHERDRELSSVFLNTASVVNDAIPNDTDYKTIFRSLTHAYLSLLDAYGPNGELNTLVECTGSPLEKVLFETIKQTLHGYNITIGELTSFASCQLQSLSKDCIRSERGE